MSTSVSTQACAACKYQRRKCSPDCPLAPYFPPDQPKQFLNVHRLFGVSNVLRILRQVNPSMKADAIKSIVYEADAWERDPVHGCLGLISVLQNQVEDLQSKLDYARSQIFLLEHSNQINSLQSYAVNPSLISTNSVYVHPSVTSTDQTCDFGISSSWAAFADYRNVEQAGIEGSAMFNINAGSGQLLSDEGFRHEPNHDLKVEVGESGAATFDLQQAVSSNRNAFSLFQDPMLSPTNDEPNINLQEDKDDLKTAAALFSLTRHH